MASTLFRYVDDGGHYPEAVTIHSCAALTLFRRNDISGGEARALGNLGHVDLWQGRYQQAAARQQMSLSLCREIGDRALVKPRR